MIDINKALGMVERPLPNGIYYEDKYELRRVDPPRDEVAELREQLAFSKDTLASMSYSEAQHDLACEELGINLFPHEDGDTLIEAVCALKQQLADVTRERDGLRRRIRDVPNPTKQGPTNCFAACVASLLSVDLESIPGVDGEKDWDWLKFQSWLHDRGLQAVEMTFANGGTIYPTGHATPCVLSGPSPRLKGKLHAVCAVLDGHSFTMTHDPQLAELWIDGEPTHATFFVPTDTKETASLREQLATVQAELKQQREENHKVWNNLNLPCIVDPIAKDPNCIIQHLQGDQESEATNEQ